MCSQSAFGPSNAHGHTCIKLLHGGFIFFCANTNMFSLCVRALCRGSTCMRGCMLRVRVCMHTGAQACGSQRSMFTVCLNCFSSLFLRRGFSTDLELIRQFSQTGWSAGQPSCPPLFKAGLTGLCKPAHPAFLHGYRGFELWPCAHTNAFQELICTPKLPSKCQELNPGLPTYWEDVLSTELQPGLLLS